MEVLELFSDLKSIRNRTFTSELWPSFKYSDLFTKQINTPIRYLSTGSRRLLATHIAFLNESSTIILDKPFEKIDPLSALYMKNYLTEISKNRTSKFMYIFKHSAQF